MRPGIGLAVLKRSTGRNHTCRMQMLRVSAPPRDKNLIPIPIPIPTADYRLFLLYPVSCILYPASHKGDPCVRA